jgi:hypothetical protein
MINSIKDEMETKEENPNPQPNVSTEDFSSELNEARWSVISFDKCAAKNLNYYEAEQKLKELEEADISGLCIVTDETAQRIAKN